jgi:CRP-like cAMP-binding protein
MREGDTGHEFFVVVSGTVAVDRGGTPVRTIEPGDFFGEIALLSESPRSATATASTPATLLVLGHREFHSLMDQYPSIRTCVLESLAKRLRSLQPDAAN